MSFIFALAYMIVEYMRPQSSYESLSGLPLAQLAIIPCIVCYFFERRERVNLTPLTIILLTYLCWFVVSYTFALQQELAWQALVDFPKWVVIFFILTNTINDRRKLYLFVVIFLLLNFKYAQFAVRIWMSHGFYSDPRGLNAGGGIGSGWFANPNDLGIALSSVFGISYYMIQSDIKRFNWLKMQWVHAICAITISIAILASSSRGAALGLAAGALAIWWKSNKKLAGILMLIVVCAVFIALIPEDNWARFTGMGSTDDGSSQSRLALWRAGIRMANEYPLTGVGPNNFTYVNVFHYFSENSQEQHNVFIQAASELGYPGLALLLLMIMYSFHSHRKTRRILLEKGANDPFLCGLSHGIDVCLISFAVNGFFITVLYYPFLWMLLILSASLADIAKQATVAEKAEFGYVQAFEDHSGSRSASTNVPGFGAH